MNILTRKIFSLLFAIGFSINAYSQQQSYSVFKSHLSDFPQSEERQQRNLEAFARLYGYVQYFHPSSEAPRDWAVLAIYGSKKMLSIGTDTELITELNNIFGPVAPSVQIFSSSAPRRFDLKKITPACVFQ